MEAYFYWYWFTNIQGIGNITRRKLLEVFQSPENIWHAKEKELEGFLTSKQRMSLFLSKETARVRRSYEKLQENHIQFLYPAHPDYPEKLKQLASPPLCLYLRGHLSKRPLVAIVGTRKASAYGMQMTRFFATELARAGFGIVSGLAAGVDAISHQTALEAGQYTLGVLGGGIDTMYPRDNFSLYLEMYERGGVLSEYNIGIPNQPGLFPERNRLISGLADALLLVEAAEKSGSLITADCALEQGKDIYVIPGRITDRLSVGCNQLIKQGAQPVQHPQEIIEDLQQRFGRREDSIQQRTPDIIIEEKRMSSEEKKIYETLDAGEKKTAGMLGRELKMEVSQVLRLLTNLELNGYVFRDEMQQYMRLL